MVYALGEQLREITLEQAVNDNIPSILITLCQRMR